MSRATSHAPLEEERRAERNGLRNHFETYRRDELIFVEGSEGDEFFIVITGLVGLFKEIDGKQRELHRIGPGEMFGEIAVINATPRSASASHSSPTPRSLPPTRPASSISSASTRASPSW